MTNCVRINVAPATDLRPNTEPTPQPTKRDAPTQAETPARDLVDGAIQGRRDKKLDSFSGRRQARNEKGGPLTVAPDPERPRVAAPDSSEFVVEEVDPVKFLEYNNKPLTADERAGEAWQGAIKIGNFLFSAPALKLATLFRRLSGWAFGVRQLRNPLEYLWRAPLGALFVIGYLVSGFATLPLVLVGNCVGFVVGAVALIVPPAWEPLNTAGLACGRLSWRLMDEAAAGFRGHPESPSTSTPVDQSASHVPDLPPSANRFARWGAGGEWVRNDWWVSKPRV